MRFSITSEISQKASWFFLFFKTVSFFQACNYYTKFSTITGIFLWIYWWEYIFSFLFFCFINNKSSHRRCLSKKIFLKISQISQKNTCVGVFFNKVTGQACNFIKKRLPCRSLPVKLAKFLRTHILNNIYELLLICKDQYLFK